MHDVSTSRSCFADSGALSSVVERDVRHRNAPMVSTECDVCPFA